MRSGSDNARSIAVLRTTALVFLFGVCSFASIQVSAQPAPADCAPLAVATAPQTPGQPLTADEVVLTGVNGEERARAVFSQPLQVTPSTVPGRSIVRSLGNVYGVLALPDSGGSAATITPIDILAGENTVQRGGPAFLVPEDSRFDLFHDPAALSAYLVDIVSGDGLALSELVDGSGTIVSAAVAPGDRWLATWTGRTIILADLTSGSLTDLSTDDEELGAPSFSDAGSGLYFLRRGADNQAKIVLHNLASGTETQLGNTGAWFWLRHFPGDILIAQNPEGLYRVPLDGSAPIALLSLNAEMRPRMIDPQGQKLLVEIRASDAPKWVLVDLTGAGGFEMPDLTGLYLPSADPQASWALLLPQEGSQQGVPGAPYTTIDLATGATTTVLTQDSDATYLFEAATGSNGQFSLVRSLSTAVGRLWLIDAQQGIAELIASSPGGAAGVLSPDGCYLAYGVFDTIGEGRQGNVEVIDLHTRQVTTTITDAILLGWASTG
ncbi:MAG: hypothetical protein R2839_00640 [Thermomicrobiales bacterium]